MLAPLCHRHCRDNLTVRQLERYYSLPANKRLPERIIYRAERHPEREVGNYARWDDTHNGKHIGRWW